MTAVKAKVKAKDRPISKVAHGRLQMLADRQQQEIRKAQAQIAALQRRCRELEYELDDLEQLYLHARQQSYQDD